MLLTDIIIFIFGLLIGSFLNAVIYRLHAGKSIGMDRSECVHCHHKLSALDLVPIGSFVFLRGRCRYCGQPISWQYPIVELITAAGFVLAAIELGISAGFFWSLIFIPILIVIAVYDLKYYLILDKIIYPAFVLAIIRSLFLHMFLDAALGAVVISGFFALQYFISGGRWIGFGDVKFGLVLGMLLGFKFGLVMLMLSYILGALVGLVLIWRGQKTMGSQLPFGSFLGLSAIIVLLFGTPLTAWYFKLLGL